MTEEWRVVAGTIAQVLREYGSCLRGDWSDFDGRSARWVLDAFADELAGKREPHDLAFHRLDIGMCPDGNGHWSRRHCSVEECPTFAADEACTA